MNAEAVILSEALVDAGHRLTRARRVIIETLALAGGHMTADELVLQVKRTSPQVGRMTVYRTLDLLTDLSLIRPIFQGTGAAHYVLMAEGNHHHLMCIRCHTVIDFETCTADDLMQALADRFDFDVQSHLLEIHGLCSACRAEK